MTSSRGKPKRPKMRMGSRMMFTMAPTSCIAIESLVRPVDCSRRSKVIWQNSPREAPRHTMPYTAP